VAPTTPPRPAVAPTERAVAAIPRLETDAEPEAPEPPQAAPAPVEAKAPEPAVEPAPEAADEPTVEVDVEEAVEAPVADEVADEPTITIEKPAKPAVVRSAKAVKVSTVPESRRAKARVRREANEKSKAEKAAIRAQERTARDRPAPAELLVAKLPGIKPVYAAVLTGLISGLICVLLAKGADAGCDAIRDEDSCGGGLGLLALVAILAIEVLIGANLLKAWKVADPFSTSFLGVGLVAMVSMLFFLNVLDSNKMLVVIPLITAVSFLISWWVTVRFVEEPDEEPEAD